MSQPTIVYTPDAPGKESKVFPGDAEVVTLREDRELGASTYLVRLAPGSQILPHSHMACAQHFVLEGACESEGKVHRAGTYHLIPAHATVGPVTTREGAVMLIVVDPRPA